MRYRLLLCLFLIAPPALADALDQLYQAAGWPEQRQHFSDALEATQQRYQNSLPPALFDMLRHNSNQRFQPEGMEGRALAQLRQSLSAPEQALAFFETPTGRKVIAAELQATRREQLAQHAQGLPRVEADNSRRLQIRHLAQTLPAGAAGAEVSLALASVAADSLSQMLPGLVSSEQAQGMLDSQRQKLRQQIEQDLDNTLLYVYRDLDSVELESFVGFAQSEAGQAYYQAALAALRAALQKP